MSHDPFTRAFEAGRRLTLTPAPDRPALEKLLKAAGAQVPAGRKDDQGKLPWHLFPFDALREIGKVLQFGAGKYAPRDWETGRDWDKDFDAAMRHLTAWYDGEDNDPESKLSHLAHAGCCVLFLLTYTLRGVGNDTRPRRPSK